MRSGELGASQTVSHAFNIEGGTTDFVFAWTEGEPAIKLVDPNGKVIDKTLAQSNTTDFVFEKVPTMAVFEVKNAIPGLWHVSIQAGNTITTNIRYATTALVKSDISLISDSGNLFQNSETSMTLSATVTGPVSTAQVTAYVLRTDGLTDTLVLTNSGTGNSYAASYRVPNAKGNTRVRYVATGLTTSGASFERESVAEFQISTNAARLAQQFSDRSNAFGIVVDVGIAASKSITLVVAADLVDGNNRLIAHTYTTKPTLAGSNLTVSLHFDGMMIRQSGSNGPYRLTNVVLLDESDTTIFLEQKDAAHTTAAYRASQFGRDFLPLTTRFTR